MGNKATNASSIDFNPQQWQPTDKQNNQTQNKGNYQVLQNIRTGQLVDQYQMFWANQQDYRFYLESFHWRRQQYNIVPSRYLLQQHTNQFCSRSYGAKVYIQHIPTRLSDVTDIPFPDNLYVALAVLQGYQKLYENVNNYFPVTQDQICVDKQGIVKVWVNSDLSKNYPQPDINASQNKDQANMVEQLLSIVWQNTDEQSEPQSFRQFYARKKGKKRIGFDQAKVIVNQYAKNVSCQIPQKFNSILQMIDQSQCSQHQEIDHQQQNLQNNQNYQNYHENQHYRQNQTPYQQNIHHEGEGQFINQESNRIYHQLPYSAQPHRIIYQRPNNFIHQNIHIPQNHYNVHPAPHILNPLFIPRKVSPHTGPIISIPPIRGNFTRINPVQTTVSYHPVPINGATQIIQNPGPIYRNSIVPQYQPAYQNQIPMRIVNHPNVQNIQSQTYHQPQQEGFKIQPFSNTNLPFQQHVSTLNPQSGSSQNHYHQQQQVNQAEAYPSRQQLNNSVGRSLQLINQSSKKASQTQKGRVNKSHINELGDVVQVNYPRQYQQGAFNSRISGTNSRIGKNSQVHNIEELQDIREELCDTKYYTINTQMQLDEEIAADLKKMIMAS